MNPGPLIEKSMDVASGAVEALRNSPSVLALVLLQLLTIGAILYNSIHRQEATAAQIAALTEIVKSCVNLKAGEVDR